MLLADALLVGGGAFLAGGMNAMAGGGTFFSFPAMLAAGIPPITANASNSVALWPASLASAWAYRREVMRHGRWAVLLGVISLIGGLCGGLLLLAISNATFSRLIPWRFSTNICADCFGGRRIKRAHLQHRETRN